MSNANEALSICMFDKVKRLKLETATIITNLCYQEVNYMWLLIKILDLGSVLIKFTSINLLANYLSTNVCGIEFMFVNQKHLTVSYE